MALIDTTWYVNFGNGSSTGYYAVATFPATTTVAAGALYRQLTTPAVGSERVFVVTTGGLTTTEPTWTNTRGALNTSGTAVFAECTGQPGVNGDTTNATVWSLSKTWVLGQQVYAFWNGVDPAMHDSRCGQDFGQSIVLRYGWHYYCR